MIIDIKDSNKGWGNTVKKRLIELGLTQKDLAEKTGIDKDRLCLCLSGKAKTFLEEVRLIESALMQWELEYARGKS